ncbi:MAG: hypothetical protein ACSLFA_25150, partial [Mycobacterium sp.]
VTSRPDRQHRIGRQFFSQPQSGHENAGEVGKLGRGGRRAGAGSIPELIDVIALAQSGKIKGRAVITPND